MQSVHIFDALLIDLVLIGDDLACGIFVAVDRDRLRGKVVGRLIEQRKVVFLAVIANAVSPDRPAVLEPVLAQIAVGTH